MPTVFTAPAGTPIAELAARHMLAVVPPERRAQAVLFVPTRRAVVTMREAFGQVLGDEASLLPRIFPLAEGGEALLTLLGAEALPLLEAIPPAMPEWQQRYFLTAQVKAFLERQQGPVSLDYALAMAEELMALQQQCARSGVTLTREKLQRLVAANMAQHWEQALAFLSILAEHWPVLEAELGMTTQAARETQLLQALADAWRAQPPAMPVFVVGSTASQEVTAHFLQTVAESPHGTVILPGLDPAIDAAAWQAVAPGHPLYHLKHFLDRLGMLPGEVVPLGQHPRSLWLDALGATEEMPHWRSRPLGEYPSLKLIPCTHMEQEARVIALLMREALEVPGKRTALITPDEGLMSRVAAQMKRYGVQVDRLTKGTLANTEIGSLWLLLLTAMREPERVLHLRSLLHHPWVAMEDTLRAQLEPYWHGTAPRRAGQLPKLPETIRMQESYPQLERLVRDLARGRGQLAASGWVEQCQALLAPWLTEEAADNETMDEILTHLADAEVLGPMSLREFAALMEERTRQPVRHGGVASHPQLSMLTPVEARLQQFDRVILASMTDAVWPGIPTANAWLNLSAQEMLGLPSPAHQVSLAAHDILMLASQAEVFFTWPQRDAGSPTTRSRFIERLVTLLAMQDVPETAITAREYAHWAAASFAAAEFMPHPPIQPLPSAEERPQILPVSALDTLFSDPFAIYARYVLRLKEIDSIDAEAQASDFGSLAHKAIQALTLHWNSTARAATEQELAQLADAALRDFSDRPSTALFWRTRLLRALGFVNGIEQERRQRPLQVQPEVTVEHSLQLADGLQLQLHGRIDRVEEGARGLTLADYKTGEIPTSKRVLEGYVTQLLAYVMLLDSPAEAIEYWRLPHGRHKGEVLTVAVADLLAAQLPEKLKAALAEMRDASTPFLANPGRFGHVYDGISRYDEWAG